MISIKDILVGIYRCNDIGEHISRAENRRTADVARNANLAENYGASVRLCLIFDLKMLDSASLRKGNGMLYVLNYCAMGTPTLFGVCSLSGRRTSLNFNYNNCNCLILQGLNHSTFSLALNCNYKSVNLQPY